MRRGRLRWCELVERMVERWRTEQFLKVDPRILGIKWLKGAQTACTVMYAKIKQPGKLSSGKIRSTHACMEPF